MPIRNSLTRAVREGLLLATCYWLLATCPGCGSSKQPDAIWCETGNGAGQVVYPRGISYDAKHDTFFIVDRMARVQQIDHSGNCVTEWRMPQWANGKPVGITVGPDGNVWIADTHYHRVMVFTTDGKEVRRFGKEGTGPGEFIFPTDVAFDQDGNVYVTEYGDNDRVQVFDQQGHYLRQFGKFGQGDGQFARPESMLVVGDTMYITDVSNHRICVFKLDGTWVRNMGTPGDGLGQFRFPYGLAMDKEGRLVVAEFGNNRVQLVDKETGKGIKTWGTGGRDPGELAYPWAVEVDRNDEIVVVDSGNNRLQTFRF